MSVEIYDRWKTDLRNFAAAVDRRRLDALAADLRLHLTARGIIALVAECYGLRPSDITGRGLTDPVVEARRLAVVICRRQLPLTSLSSLGRSFNRDHSTIIFHLKRSATPEWGFDWESVEAVERILARIRAPLLQIALDPNRIFARKALAAA